MQIEIATLVNGEQVPVSVVKLVLGALETLMKSDTGREAVDDLRDICETRGARMYGPSGSALYAAGLLKSWDPSTSRATVRDDIKAVVLLAVQGRFANELHLVKEITSSISPVND